MKQTIQTRMSFLEGCTKYKVDYMSGGQYFFRSGKKYADIVNMNKAFNEVGLEIKSVNVNDSGTLTFQLGEV